LQGRKRNSKGEDFIIFTIPFYIETLQENPAGLPSTPRPAEIQEFLTSNTGFTLFTMPALTSKVDTEFLFPPGERSWVPSTC
jgi:hypothetical protein